MARSDSQRMMPWWRRWALGRRRPAPVKDGPWLQQRTDTPDVIYAVGDVHGCVDLYRKLEARAVSEAAERGQSVLLILLGDLVDRGPETAALLDHVTAPPPQGLERLALMGNHEEKMLKFIDAPRQHADWLGWGGYETLMSYGMTPALDPDTRAAEKRMRQSLDAHIPSEHIAFLRALPLALRIGPYYFCHAGIDADRPLDDQSPQDLLWRRDPPQAMPEGVTLIHGHTPVEDVDVRGPVINVDTGAFKSGRLSAVRLTANAPPEAVSVT